MIDWNIQTRAHVCQSCGKRFEDKQAYHTLLFDEKQEFKRSDVCPRCWQEQFHEGGRDRKGFVSYWQGTYEAPPPLPPDPMQKETIESLLRKIIEQNDPRYAATSYILAVMLERKRLLKVKEQFKRDGRRIFVYEHAQSGDVFSIPDPDLQLDQLEQVQHDVALLLEHGFNPPPADGSTPPAGDAQAPPAGPADPNPPLNAAADEPPPPAAGAGDAAPPGAADDTADTTPQPRAK